MEPPLRASASPPAHLSAAVFGENVSQGGGAAHAAKAEVPLRAERRFSARACSPADTRRVRTYRARKATTAPAQRCRERRARARSAAKIRCLFHANWTPIPAQAGHPFHANLDRRSEATRGVDVVYARVGSSVNLGWIFRRGSPARLRGWAWWTRRSRMASATPPKGLFQRRPMNRRQSPRLEKSLTISEYPNILTPYGRRTAQPKRRPCC